MTTADEWVARWRDTWHKIAASEFAGETVYSHEAFGVGEGGEGERQHGTATVSE